MPTRKRSAEEVDQLATEATDAYLRRASITYLECCVSLMLTHLSRQEVAQILKEEAELVKQLG